MFKIRFNKGGVVLLIVLGTLLIVTSLATVILSLILSHRRLTYHQTSRIQAYYAAQAGMNYAYEMLRLGPAAGGWAPNPNACPAPGCSLRDLDSQFAATFPISIQDVRIILISPGPDVVGCNTTAATPVPAGITACIQTTATYTYTP